MTDRFKHYPHKDFGKVPPGGPDVLSEGHTHEPAQWSATPPTEPGHYWARTAHCDPYIVMASHGSETGQMDFRRCGYESWFSNDYCERWHIEFYSVRIEEPR